MQSVELSIFGQDFVLLPQRAIYWKQKSALLLSDLHLGKASHFRKHGLALPGALGVRDLENLQELLLQQQPKQVFFLGDLFHSSFNVEVSWFLDFLNQFPHIQFMLVRGNHDIIPSYLLKAPNLSIAHKYIEEGICLIHEPRGNESEYVVCGHIHPSVVLKGKARQQLRLPCFVVGESRLILPAFGRLTGLASFVPLPSDGVYAIAGGDVIKK